jgi:hypothetical protein
MADTRCHDGDFVVNADSGFLGIEPGESVIVLSKILDTAGTWLSPTMTTVHATPNLHLIRCDDRLQP